MYYDFHTHIHQYEDNDPDLLQIEQHQIISIASSMDIESYTKTKTIARGNRFIVPTFGIHPFNADKGYVRQEIENLLDDSKIIGEIGLDYYWAKHICRKMQEELFEIFLEHCNSTNKYCIIHTKGAEKRVLDMLDNYPKAKPIIHWYHGPKKHYKRIIERNYKCTFGCELKYSRYIRKLVTYTPNELLLCETDNPESDTWLGGSRKDPLLIKDVLMEIAKAKKMDFEEVKTIINTNSKAILDECGIHPY